MAVAPLTTYCNLTRDPEPDHLTCFSHSPDLYEINAGCLMLPITGLLVRQQLLTSTPVNTLSRVPRKISWSCRPISEVSSFLLLSFQPLPLHDLASVGLSTRPARMHALREQGWCQCWAEAHGAGDTEADGTLALILPDPMRADLVQHPP